MYHIPVALQIRDEASCLAFGLEPPGNLGRELVLYKRSLFAAFGAAAGDASALAFPELAALAFARAPAKGGSQPWASPSLRARALADAWRKIEGGFASTELFVSEGRLYLGLEGPWESLAAAALELCAFLGLERDDSAGPYPPLRGFFLCADPGPRPEALPKPPRLSFRDASLVALRLHWREEPAAGPSGPSTPLAAIVAASWTERCRARRRTGADERPSRRRPRSEGS